MYERLWASFSDADLEERLRLIAEAILSDAQTITHNGETIQYRSVRHMRDVAREISGELDRREAAAGAGVKRRKWTFKTALPGGKGYI